jgi:hypothetical protein
MVVVRTRTKSCRICTVLWEVDGSPELPVRTDCRQRRVYESSKIVEELILEDRHVLCALPWPKNANVASGGD